MRLLALLAAGMFTGGLVAEDKKDEKKVKDEEAILGTWQIVMEDYGDTEPYDAIANGLNVRWTFEKGGKVTTTLQGRKGTDWDFKLDPSVKPKALDLSGHKDKDSTPCTNSIGIR